MTNLQQIKDELRAVRDAQARLEQCHESTLNSVGKIASSLQNYHEAVIRLEENKCPSPGLCKSLEEETKEHSGRIRSLEDTRTAATGGWKTLAVLMSISAGLGGLLVWVLDLLNRLKP